MAQRVRAAKLLLEGKTYQQVIEETEISSATLSRVSHLRTIWRRIYKVFRLKYTSKKKRTYLFQDMSSYLILPRSQFWKFFQNFMKLFFLTLLNLVSSFLPKPLPALANLMTRESAPPIIEFQPNSVDGDDLFCTVLFLDISFNFIDNLIFPFIRTGRYDILVSFHILDMAAKSSSRVLPPLAIRAIREAPANKASSNPQ